MLVVLNSVFVIVVGFGIDVDLFVFSGGLFCCGISMMLMFGIFVNVRIG